MNTIILGASGATGRLVAEQLINRKIKVRAVVRESTVLPKQVINNSGVEIIKGNINDFGTAQIKDMLKDCDAVVCCLGHNISFKGIVGPPHKLVLNAVRKITEALQSLNKNQKFILMSTTAYTNKSSGEMNSVKEKLVFSLLKVLLPPHKDNLLAADHLVYNTDPRSGFEWVAVRPDSLFDEDVVSEYEIHNNILRSPIFNPGKTSRINVAHFMVELLTNDKLWQEWKHKTPVIYNKGFGKDQT
jgi:nucleoside-diphosphate-sugar epimerase